MNEIKYLGHDASTVINLDKTLKHFGSFTSVSMDGKLM